MKQNNLTLAALALSVLAIAAVFFHNQPATQQSAPKTETAYERVMRTQTIRCGYFVWPPYFIKDPQTGKFSGFTYDVAEKLGSLLNLKIEWSQEVYVGQEVDALNAGKIDVICSAMTTSNPNAAKYLEHTNPYLYIGLHMIGRKDETRFKNVADLNDPAVKISYMDGDVSEVLKRDHFPKATAHALPNTSDPQLMMYDVMNRKADVTLIDIPSLQNFSASNPDKLKVLFDGRTLANYPVIFSTKQEDGRLSKLISSTTAYMNDVGILDQILDANKVDAMGVKRLTKPYHVTVVP